MRARKLYKNCANWDPNDPPRLPLPPQNLPRTLSGPLREKKRKRNCQNSCGGVKIHLTLRADLAVKIKRGGRIPIDYTNRLLPCDLIKSTFLLLPRSKDSFLCDRLEVETTADRHLFLSTPVIRPRQNLLTRLRRALLAVLHGRPVNWMHSFKNAFLSGLYYEWEEKLGTQLLSAE